MKKEIILKVDELPLKLRFFDMYGNEKAYVIKPNKTRTGFFINVIENIN